MCLRRAGLHAVVVHKELQAAGFILLSHLSRLQVQTSLEQAVQGCKTSRNQPCCKQVAQVQVIEHLRPDISRHLLKAPLCQQRKSLPAFSGAAATLRLTVCLSATESVKGWEYLVKAGSVADPGQTNISQSATDKLLSGTVLLIRKVYYPKRVRSSNLAAGPEASRRCNKLVLCLLHRMEMAKRG